MTRLETKLIALVMFLLVSIVIAFLQRLANKRNIKLIVFGVATLLAIMLMFIINRSALVDNSDPNQSEIVSSKALVDLQSEARVNPSSVKAWNKLGREYLLQQDFEKAYQAFNESRQVDFSALFESYDSNQNDPITKDKRVERLKWLTGIAESRILAQRGAIDEESEKYLNLALKLDSTHPKALWYGGLSAAQKEQYDVAKEYWRQLKAQEPPGALGQILDQRLQSLDQLMLQAIDEVGTNEINNVKNWQLKLKVLVPDELKSTVTSQTRIFLSLRQDLKQPPLAAKQLKLKQLQDIVILSSSDAIPAMRAQQTVNWDSPLRFDILWAPSGKVDGKGNIRFASMLNRDNLNGVNEFVLDPKLALKE